eukprot:TRINITY_DN21148_c0_g1_i1.p1 TRINITY_DN21148_c0_g1~~TRINITY_DN21148_c0_g1_i1.p1  ORF type:complete len:254 (-),score=34.99 TRINITY_DN21148_c0_g1_i1:295-1056(-)
MDPMAAKPAVKVQAFRNFAMQLMAQVTEQLCQEYEREVAMLTNDVMSYRNELTRVADLLAHQLGRERQLHGILDQMNQHHANIANAAHQVASQQPNKQMLMEMVEQVCGTQSQIMNSTLNSVSQASAVSQTHTAHAKQLQDPMISAENELNRIMQMLQTPIVTDVPPGSVHIPMAGSSSAAVASGSHWGSPAPSPMTHSHPSMPSYAAPPPPVTPSRASSFVNPYAPVGQPPPYPAAPGAPQAIPVYAVGVGQ